MALRDLLMDAAKDQAVLTNLITNREAVMEEYQLSEEEKSALREGDKDKINELLSAPTTQELALTLTVIMVPIVWVSAAGDETDEPDEPEM